MADRKFKLPNEEDLNKDQDRVLALPEDGQYLVVGGPGTGKSVVALLRALKFKRHKNYIFLVYNRVLQSVTRQLISSGLTSSTLLSYFYKLYRHLFNERVPETAPYKPDYELVIKKLQKLDCAPRPLHFIIDEGQDMPPGFYQALQYAGYEHFFIVADQNQQITDDNSSRQELTDLLGLEAEDVIELKINYRNTRPIAFFANHFFSDPASPPPAIPERNSIDTPILLENITAENCSKMILREADKDDRKLIGVVTATNRQRERYAAKLAAVEMELDNPRPQISTYKSDDRQNVKINFAAGGVVVLNDKSIKGLEFDIVFIILDDFQIFNNDRDSLKKRFYVMSSRAISKLVLLSENPLPKEINDLLPDDENLLKRVKGQISF